MFASLRPQYRFAKPPPGNQVDFQHRLAPASCWLMNEGAGKRITDACQGYVSVGPVHTNLPAWVPTPNGGYGIGLRFVAAQDQGFLLSTQRWVSAGNSPCTMAILFRTTSSTGAGFYGETGLGVVPRMVMLINNGVVGRIGVALKNDAGTLINTNATVSSNDGAWHIVHGVNEGDGRTIRLYMDGIQRATSANTLGPNMTITASAIGNDNVGDPYDGDLSFVMTFRRAFSAQEVADHAKNPFQAFLPLRPLQPSLLPATTVIDRLTMNPRPASRIARGGL